MRKLRHLIGLCVLCAALLAVGTASAHELQTSFDVPRLALYATSRSSGYLAYTSEGNYAVDGTRTYTVTAVSSEVKGLDIIVGLLDNTYGVSNKADMLYHAPEIEPQLNASGNCVWVFSYTFRQSGKHAVLFQALDEDGNAIDGGLLSLTMTIPDKTGSELSTAISDVVASLDTSDSYTAALSIHDWLTGHAAYDHSYVYYNPYDLIVNGTGTCNGYARAFSMMMAAAGYSAERVIGYQRSTGEQHAWNLALLDGEWYQIDATWNDPSSGPTHLYFGLTNELMLVDHSFRFMAGGGTVRTCSSLDCNYYVRSRAWQTCAAATIAALQDQIDSGFTSLSTLLKTTAGTDFYLLTEMQAQVFGTIFAREMPNYLWYHTASGTPVQVSLSYTYYGQVGGVQKGEFTGTYTRENEMTLPSGVTAIEEEAFAGVTAARYLTVPESCTAIGARAFAESGFWCVYLPAELTDIAADAFEDAPYLRVLAPSGSAAAAKLRTLNVNMATY